MVETWDQGQAYGRSFVWIDNAELHNPIHLRDERHTTHENDEWVQLTELHFDHVWLEVVRISIDNVHFLEESWIVMSWT